MMPPVFFVETVVTINTGFDFDKCSGLRLDTFYSADGVNAEGYGFSVRCIIDY